MGIRAVPSVGPAYVVGHAIVGAIGPRREKGSGVDIAESRHLTIWRKV